MKNITEQDTNEIRAIKSKIQTLELSLEKYMNADLSDSAVRGKMRKVLNKIDSAEAALTTKVDSLK